jgi:hypothetical protein
MAKALFPLLPPVSCLSIRCFAKRASGTLHRSWKSVGENGYCESFNGRLRDKP